MIQANNPSNSMHKPSSSLFEGLVPFAILFTASAWSGFWMGYDLVWSPTKADPTHMVGVAHDQFWELVSIKYKTPLKVVLGLIFAGAGFLIGMPLGYAIKQRRLKSSGTTTALVLLLVLLSVLFGETLHLLYQCKAHFGYYDLAKAWELFCSPFAKGLGSDFIGLIIAIVGLLLRAVVGLMIYFAAQRGLMAPEVSIALKHP